MCAFWLKWEKGLTRKQEILQIAARLMVSPSTAAGCLMLAMEWLDDAVTDYDGDGNANVTLGALPVSFIDSIVGVSGYADALCEVGWLRHKDGVLTFVNAGRHNGNTAKKRALTRERVEKHREQKVKRQCNAESVTNSLLFSSVCKEGVQGEKSTKPMTVIPLLLSTETFAEAWRAWLRHRREIKKPVIPGSEHEREQLKMLEGWGEERAIAALKFTIFKGWQGIKEPTDRDLNEFSGRPAPWAQPATKPERLPDNVQRKIDQKNGLA